MARSVRDASLETRTAGARLPIQREPHWRAIEKGAHLGYYRGDRRGSWIARLYVDGRYYKTKLGKADDILDADGTLVLNFWQAQETRVRGLPTRPSAPAASRPPAGRTPWARR